MAKRAASQAQASLFAEEAPAQPLQRAKHIRFDAPPTPAPIAHVDRTIVSLTFDNFEPFRGEGARLTERGLDLTLDCTSDETVSEYALRAAEREAERYAKPAIEVTDETRALMARLDPFTGNPRAAGVPKPHHPGPWTARDVEPPGVVPSQRRAAARKRPEHPSVARARIAKVTAELRVAPEGIAYVEAHRAQCATKWRVVKVVPGAEGDYQVITTAHEELTLAYRRATCTAFDAAMVMGAKSGDWSAIAMRLERGGSDEGSAAVHAHEPPADVEELYEDDEE